MNHHRSVDTGLTARAAKAIARVSLAMVLALALPALPAMADDDDNDDRGGSQGAQGGGSRGGGNEGGGGAGSTPLVAIPGSGEFGRDVNSLLGLVFGRPRPPAPPPPTRIEAGRDRETNELVVRDLGPRERARLQAQGFGVVAQRPGLVRLRVPSGMSLETARDRVRAEAPGSRVDFNHLYRPSQARDCEGPTCLPFDLIGWPGTDRCGVGRIVGLIDTGVDARVQALAGRVQRITVRGSGRQASSTAHGTAVAVLLAGSGQGAERGLLPGARVFAVDAFHRRPDGDAADAFDIAAAIQRLSDSGVRVVAMPFAGPRNDVVDAAGDAAAARGMLAVAAAGNDGADAPPRFPAASPWAIAVTGVDARGQVYPQAVRGPHIAFAAPGVGLRVVTGAGRPPVARSGTSYAVPFVAAALLAAGANQAATESLAQAAGDLGAPGRDPVFGWGLLRASSC